VEHLDATAIVEDGAGAKYEAERQRPVIFTDGSQLALFRISTTYVDYGELTVTNQSLRDWSDRGIRGRMQSDGGEINKLQAGPHPAW